MSCCKPGCNCVRCRLDRAESDRLRRGQPVTKIERNHPCPCGSGYKFKNCCWLQHKQNQVNASLASNDQWAVEQERRIKEQLEEQHPGIIIKELAVAVSHKA